MFTALSIASASGIDFRRLRARGATAEVVDTWSDESDLEQDGLAAADAGVLSPLLAGDRLPALQLDLEGLGAGAQPGPMERLSLDPKEHAEAEDGGAAGALPLLFSEPVVQGKSAGAAQSRCSPTRAMVPGAGRAESLGALLRHPTALLLVGMALAWGYATGETS